jgi:hypothetical protein
MDGLTMRNVTNNEPRLLFAVLIIAALVVTYLLASAVRTTYLFCDDVDNPGVIVCNEGN